MIKFEKLRWKNILSTGNTFTEIDLLRSTNTLIIGHNGAGKSTILDALCFALFGKPFRKINKPSLLNSINQAEGVVEVEFSIGRKQYKVIRGIKPNIFEIYCNGVMVNQDAKVKDYQEQLEKFILKLNFKSFTQVVILGSASFVPFMQLSPGDRRTIIEDLLDINIFSSMNSIVKEKMSAIKDESTKNKYEMELTSEKIKLQKQNIEEHKKHSADEIEKKRGEVETSEKQIKQLQTDIELIQKHISSLNKMIADEKSISSKSSKLVQLESKLETKLKKINKDILFYNDHDECPTCRQHIDQEFKDKELSGLNSGAGDIATALTDIEKQIQSANDRINEITKINKHITEHNNEVLKHISTITAINNYVVKLGKEIVELQDLHINLDTDNQVLKDLRTSLQSAVERQEELSNKKQYLEYASTLLKDTGIKTKIIKQYLPIMNKLINKYLSAMDFFVNFNINENFEETIKSRHRDEFTYANFSEGEKQKIDMALLLTWRQIARIKNSTNTNLLILDEIFDSSLDSASVELLMGLLNELGNDTNIFVISHKGDQLFDKFRSVIKFVKHNNFSVVEK
ncbi:endonuclease subunit [uncultured Caudovirales phage]|uniref:Endonuclease subunit n=1 Tax=uncultured Caudovirales phage TaxID=2100421 RepID=A0A6J5LJY5_9CAUD|nr:endonuclease subunit [uncultured Caudovirales phage]